MSFAVSRLSLFAWLPSASRRSSVRVAAPETAAFPGDEAAPRDSLFASVAAALSPGAAVLCPGLTQEIARGMRRTD